MVGWSSGGCNMPAWYGNGVAVSRKTLDDGSARASGGRTALVSELRTIMVNLCWWARGAPLSAVAPTLEVLKETLQGGSVAAAGQDQRNILKRNLLEKRKEKLIKNPRKKLLKNHLNILKENLLKRNHLKNILKKIH